MVDRLRERGSRILRRGARTFIRAVDASDRDELIAANLRSRKLHHPWVSAPCDAEGFELYLSRLVDGRHLGILTCEAQTGAICGVINVNEIVRGLFHSAYLGFYACAGHQERGLMKEGLGLVLSWSFSTLRLHRLEANIQPGNRRSIGLVRALGFRKEGYSPRYLKINGRWRDHERWAILAEEWSTRRGEV